MYHYAGNNPVKYTDPDGRDILVPCFLDYQNTTENTDSNMGYTVTGRKHTLDGEIFHRNTIGRYGCLFTAFFNVANDIKVRNIKSKAPSVKSVPNSILTDYSNSDKYFSFTDYEWIGDAESGYFENDALMSISNMKALISDVSGIDKSKIKITEIKGSSKIASELYSLSHDHTRNAYVIGAAKNHDNPNHCFNILDAAFGAISQIHDVYKNNYKDFEQNVKQMQVTKIYIIEIER